MAKSTNHDFLGDSKAIIIKNIYDKLFYGCNLLAIKGDGEDYFPTWDNEEIKTLQLVVDNGLGIILKNLI
ncbi:MAG: hypothetical protein K0S76_3047 [Herbinix sp.]|jgi:hypothetical protein|nr:hypothetical protein [Herbinix sp.]MDF2540026.1 hypothetical protein [Herbinix sp.]